MTLPRVGVVCDFREENWPSMDLVADMLLTHLQADYSDVLTATRICPPMRRRFTREREEGQRAEVNGRGSGVHNAADFRGKRFNADRVLNRYWDYPRFVRELRSQFDLFHVIDHSYGQLLHELPAERTVITCHDLDTFQCLLNPQQERRSLPFRKMMSRTLSGFRNAARVTCDSIATRDDLLAHNLVTPDRAVVIPNGVHPSFSTAQNPEADAEAARLLGSINDDAADLLHVGSTIPRKRIDLLLRIFAAAREEVAGARLIRVGDGFTPDQVKLINELGIADAILVLPRLQSEVLAAVYRRATLLLQPSEREGFGLPVVEAMACGTPVIASDLPVLREVGGEATTYCAVGDIHGWKAAVLRLFTERKQSAEISSERRRARIRQAAKFSWAEYARKMAGIYCELLQTRG